MLDADGFIQVVAGVVVRDERLLLCQRPAGPHLPLLWEFPGGKIEEGESPAEALARELTEELGVAARVGEQIHEVRHRYPEKKVWIRFLAAAIDGEPLPRIHRAICWVPPQHLDRFEVPPANAPVVDRLRAVGLGAIAELDGR